MTHRPRRTAILIALTLLLLTQPVAAAPEGQMSWAVHVSLAPTSLDPAEISGTITSFTRISRSRSDDTEQTMNCRGL